MKLELTIDEARMVVRGLDCIDDETSSQDEGDAAMALRTKVLAQIADELAK